MRTPDNFVILKFLGDDPHYRVLAGWSGGFATGDYWRMNSGVVRHTFDGDYWYFYGSSGSCYKCHVDSYGLRMNNSYVWTELKQLHGDKVKFIEEQEWDKPDWDWILKETKDAD